MKFRRRISTGSMPSSAAISSMIRFGDESRFRPACAAVRPGRRGVGQYERKVRVQMRYRMQPVEYWSRRMAAAAPARTRMRPHWLPSAHASARMVPSGINRCLDVAQHIAALHRRQEVLRAAAQPMAPDDSTPQQAATITASSRVDQPCAEATPTSGLTTRNRSAAIPARWPGRCAQGMVPGG